MNVPRHRSSASVPRRTQWGGTLLGVFIGLVLGIALAASVGLYVTGGWKAYQQQIAGNRDARDAREPVKTAKADAEKPRFDFYKILPGGEDPKSAAKPAPPDRALADKAAGRPAPEQPMVEKGKPSEPVASVDQGAKTAVPERFWLQAGSFTTESDAENLRARLAMAGWEAQMQQGQLADKATRYRVRLGPYDNVTELNRVKGELARRGFDVAVIRY
jgi:cell division protein FtsN